MSNAFVKERVWPGRVLLLFAAGNWHMLQALRFVAAAVAFLIGKGGTYT
jgi:hypothetical protein